MAPKKKSGTQPEAGAILELDERSGDPLSLDLIRSEKGIIRPCDHNAKVLMAAAPQFDDLYFDEFEYRMRIGDRAWTDHDDRDAVCWLQSKYRVPGFTLGQVRTAATSLAYSRKSDSLFEFVMHLPKWDGEARIAMAFIDAWGATNTALTRAASFNFFVSMMARAIDPGAQVDTVITLEGPQGAGKSQSMRKLGGKYHAEISAQVGTSDFQRELRGIWLAELSELDALRGHEASTIKRLLSATQDRFVEKYEKHAVVYPRRAVFVATTNEHNYWRDSTGGRRLIPIRVGEIRLDLIEEMRVQWFAEALSLYRFGSKWWEFPAGTETAQEDRQIIDPWEDILRAAIVNGRRAGAVSIQWPDGWISSAEIMREWLQLAPHQQAQASSTRLGRIMRRLGFAPKRFGGERGWIVDASDSSSIKVSR